MSPACASQLSPWVYCFSAPTPPPGSGATAISPRNRIWPSTASLELLLTARAAFWIRNSAITALLLLLLLRAPKSSTWPRASARYLMITKPSYSSKQCLALLNSVEREPKPAAVKRPRDGSSVACTRLAPLYVPADAVRLCIYSTPPPNFGFTCRRP